MVALSQVPFYVFINRGASRYERGHQTRPIFQYGRLGITILSIGLYDSHYYGFEVCYLCVFRYVRGVLLFGSFFPLCQVLQYGTAVPLLEGRAKTTIRLPYFLVFVSFLSLLLLILAVYPYRSTIS